VSPEGRRFAWFALWAAALGGLLAAVLQTLHVSADLRLFLPQAATTEQALVLEGIGEGPAARLLMLSLEGADSAGLAETSQRLVEALRGNPSFRVAANGSGDIPRWVIDNRYLLTASFDERPLDAETLRIALQDRLQDLASPAAPALESFVPSDPTLEIAAIGSAWAAGRSPRRIGGVWFDAAGRKALVLVQTNAAGFDPDGQQRALD
jgi:predicted exporter